MDIYLKDYAYLGDNVLAIGEALRHTNNGDTLHLGGGVIELTNTYAVGKNYYYPRYEDETKFYAIYVENKDNITIDGDGAKLMMIGDVSPFGVEDCSNIKICNLSIDYKTPHFWQAEITEVCDNYLEVEYDKDKFPCQYDAKTKTFRFGTDGDCWYGSSLLANEFEIDKKRKSPTSPDYFLCLEKPHKVYDFMSSVVDTEVVGENKFRFNYVTNPEKPRRHKVGNMLVIGCHERKNANMQFHKCKNITVNDVDMYASGSFGILCVMCENITLNRYNCRMEENSDRMLAVLADNFHCCNCRGHIEVNDCVFENSLDDSINVHTKFAVVKSQINKNTLLIHFTYLAKRALNLFSPGERISVLDDKSFAEKKMLTVKRCDEVGQYHLRIEFEEDVDEIASGMLLMSEDAKPTMHISGCKSGNGRGRGFIVTNGNKTLIEDCVFYTHGSAIRANGACKSYLEGRGINGLTIRNCDFTHAGYCGTSTIQFYPSDLEKFEEYINNDILIENNKFIYDVETIFLIRSAKNVAIRDNKYYTSDGKEIDATDLNDKIQLEFCENINY